jgi:hypothetical protein
MLIHLLQSRRWDIGSCIMHLVLLLLVCPETQSRNEVDVPCPALLHKIIVAERFQLATCWAKAGLVVPALTPQLQALNSNTFLPKKSRISPQSQC